MTWSVEVVESRLFAGVVADEIIASIQDVLSESNQCYCTLAGGKTPAETYRLMCHPPRVDDVEWTSVRFFLSDERYVPISDAQSNYKMIQETLLTHLSGRAKVEKVDTTLTDPEEAARRYEQLVRDCVPANDAGTPQFDILLLGIGEDGHLGAIFPQSEAFSETGRIYAAVDHPSNSVSRITITPKLLLAAKKVIIMARGKGKAGILKRILEGNEDPHQLPGRLLKDHAGKVTWFIDTESAQGLSRK